MNKTDLTKASGDMEAAFRIIEQASLEHSTLMVYDDNWAESFKAFIETFEPRLIFFRKKLNKYIDLVNEENKRQRRKSAQEKERKKRVKKNNKV